MIDYSRLVARFNTFHLETNVEGGCLLGDDIARLEDLLGFAVPSPLKEILTEVGYQECDGGVEVVRGDVKGSVIAVFLGANAEDVEELYSSDLIKVVKKLQRLGCRHKLLPFCRLINDSFLCLNKESSVYMLYDRITLNDDEADKENQWNARLVTDDYVDFLLNWIVDCDYV